MFAIIGILMALRSREQSGRGQFVDISMFDAMISGMSSCFMIYLGSNVCPAPMGSSYPTIVPYRVFPSQDRDFSLAVGSEKLWTAFCKAIDRLDLEHHPDYATNALRIRHRAAFEGMLMEMFRRHPAQHWLDRLKAAGVPCSLVRNLREVVEDPQSRFRELFPVIEHPTIGPHRVTGTPIKFSDTPGGGSLPAPLLGEHTRTALAELLHLDGSALTDLAHRGVIFDPSSANP